jgi:hypothetical protein
MNDRLLICLAILAGALSYPAIPACAAELIEEMRTMARIFTLLDARDQKGYCVTMHDPPYRDYLDSVCRLAVQKRLKRAEDCSPEQIKLESKADAEQCLAMSPDEFEKTVRRGREGREAFVQDLAA